jgi:hypothetical protein
MRVVGSPKEKEGLVGSCDTRATRLSREVRSWISHSTVIPLICPWGYLHLGAQILRQAYKTTDDMLDFSWVWSWCRICGGYALPPTATASTDVLPRLQTAPWLRQPFNRKNVAVCTAFWIASWLGLAPWWLVFRFYWVLYLSAVNNRMDWFSFSSYEYLFRWWMINFLTLFFTILRF